MRSRLAPAFALLALLAGRAGAQATQSPHEAGVGTCTTCHVASGWKPVKVSAAFQHAPKLFPLDGAHARVNCAGCHASLDFRQAPTACASCHKDVHLGELGTDCARCHTTRAFTDQARLARAHEQTRFPLRGAHAAVPCESCHLPAANGTPQFVNRPTNCYSCHQTDLDRAKNPDHRGAKFPTDCSLCHGLATWQDARFDHNATAFPLTGAHGAATCAACHADGVYRGKPTACVACHQADYAQTRTPPHQAAGFATTCATCHTTTAWLGAPFDHATTQFPLTGAHQTVTCAECHADGVYKGKPTTCVSCHQSTFNATTSPPHASAGFSTDCATCHTTSVWSSAPFDHAATQFPLTGAHLTVTCAQCHGDGVFKGKSTSCVSCHQAAFDGTTNPPHQAAGFATTCATCHSTATWSGAPFDHATTQFPLTGAHQAVSCAQCHGDGVFKGKSTTCVSCHQADFTTTASPPHQAAGFATTCATCHTTTTWTGAVFDHGTTQFPLTGAHQTVACAACHADGVYRGKPTSCNSCHQADYTRTTNPPHAAAGYGTTCESCHTTASWQSGTFDHSTTRFPLTGAHQAVACAQCHGDGVYQGKPTTSVSCHQADYNGTTNPPHAATGYGTTCQTCHTTASWSGATFDHNTTQFPLTGAHRATPCSACHSDGVYQGKSTACASCHQADYNGTTNPPHQAAGFPTTCATCHTTTVWTGAVFDHNTTQFPLTGAHQAAPCASCHGDGVYHGKPTSCVSCHQADYNGTTNPPHQAAGFPTTCATCHTTTVWTGAVFDHNTTQFPLTGAHQAAACASCHGDGVYQGKSTACVSCHQTDYNGTNNPPHQAAGFATTCATCHTTTVWTSAVFDHNATQFPLTGAHQAVPCTSCHGDGVYHGKSTACVSCHQTDYNGTTDPPHQAAGFATTCATCHTTTAWTGAVFNHSTTQFPLTGAHVTVACSACHGDGVYAGKSTACQSCHQADYNATTNPNHAAAGFPVACASCHTTTTWQGATFDHDAQYFPIYSGHHRGRWTSCTDCHTSSTNYAVFTCLTCHTQSATDSQHRGRSGYSYNSQACYSCHPRGSAG